ncbi:hypothetical protein EUX98_g3612 [Antrodiella citrinella]|uniref:Potassium transport protein n=1 Tax=Antrodiella citrinella TaxID=2447956 RepID=A0A4S4MW58_9APHY|nr:hypothetical protein EUX98_g3612 [Antrodiella citrinella]
MVRRTDIAPQRINPTGTVDVAAETIEARTTSARQHIQDSEDRMPRTQTRVTISEQPPPVRSKEEGFGGFPGPQDLTSKILMKVFPGLHRKIRRTLTVPQTHTFVPQDEAHDEQFAASSTLVPYFSFTATVGRNSVFLNLTEEQMDELGGVEYRALNTLLWVTPLYYFGLMIIGLIIIAPYMYLPRWKANFVPPQQHRKISPMWFSLFQVVGAWSNTGMSLVDQNLEPFQNAYPMLVVLIFLVMAGNTAFPILFRFTCWLLRKAFTLRTSTGESLLFLLHHPRRCFINLFPARQTWLLLIIVAALTLVTMIGDLVLNIGNPVMDAIPVGRRILLALVQSAATRSAGFQPFPLSDQYPAALVLYVITMYIAIYPIAMSVRSTNVYEEQSLGIYPSETLNTYPDSNDSEHRIAIWGKYLMRHARRQLSFATVSVDMWWLALSLLLIAIVERPGLTDPAKSSWLNLFALIFELVSAYGTVGLSLGVPNENYSLSGALHPLSKLIVCVVMLRGRHRGLPVALDRAVMMPQEFRKHVTIHNSTSSVPQPPSPKPSEVEAEAEETTSSSEGVGSDNVVQSSAAMQSLEPDEKTRNGEFEGESDVNVV